MTLVTRHGLLISGDDFTKDLDRNVTGATLIRYRNWFARRNQYFLYFSGHHGKYIRLALAKSPLGPYRTTNWRIAPISRIKVSRIQHVASPEIYRNGRKSYLLTHSPVKRQSRQMTFAGRIWFGRLVLFSRQLELPSYARVFQHRGKLYAVSKSGKLFQINRKFKATKIENVDKSRALEPFEGDETRSIRHPHIAVIDGHLICLFTRIGDCPERVFASRITHLDEGRPTFGPPLEIIRPEEPFEGSEIKLQPSPAGTAKTPVNALRDPFLYEEDGKYFLLYSVKGEAGIAMASIDANRLLKELEA